MGPKRSLTRLEAAAVQLVGTAIGALIMWFGVVGRNRNPLMPFGWPETIFLGIGAFVGFGAATMLLASSPRSSEHVLGADESSEEMRAVVRNIFTFENERKFLSTTWRRLRGRS